MKPANILLLSVFLFCLAGLQAQTVKDVDGNVYNTVTIGSQTWMKENLKVTKYRNGDPIANVTDGKAWSNLTTGAYCDYSNKPSNGKTYGKLYSYYSIVDSRSLCPTGWHVPSDVEWTTLTTFVGGENVAGDKLKEKGFYSLHGGMRADQGMFMGIDGFSCWGSSTEGDKINLWYRTVYDYVGSVMRSKGNKTIGFSIRCLKD